MAAAEGDIVVAATDGVFDNVYPDEIVSLVAMQLRRGAGPKEAATALAQFARQRAADTSHLSPFAYGAQQRGYRCGGGLPGRVGLGLQASGDAAVDETGRHGTVLGPEFQGCRTGLTPAMRSLPRWREAPPLPSRLTTPRPHARHAADPLPLQVLRGEDG